MASRKRVPTPSTSRKKSALPKKAATSRAEKDAAALRQAQKLARQAGKTEDCGEEVRLATEALQLSRDCADAYLILAQHTFHAQDALPFFAEARRAAGKVLGKEAFRKHSGSFWNRATTRPYMQSCGGLAECLWSTGCRKDALALWREMLKLNPRDDQGARYPLLAGLLEMQLPAEALEVLAQFPESTAGWDFHRALLAFQLDGDSENTRKLIKQANKSNKHVAKFLLKDDVPPDELPEVIKP
jgi:tetratricopeptide (TPR) repeat protein